MGLRQVSRTNSNTTTEIWSPRSKIQHPKPSVKFLVTLGGSTRDPFMPSKPHVPNYFPFRIHGLGTWIMSWMFLTFLASIYWNLNNLVSAPLLLEVQFWERWWNSIILWTSTDVIALGQLVVMFETIGQVSKYLCK